jgi:hypothetical protein
LARPTMRGMRSSSLRVASSTLGPLSVDTPYSSK